MPVKEIGYVAGVRTKEQYDWAMKKDFKYVIARPELILKDENPDISKLVLTIPAIIHLKETDTVKKQIEKVRNMGVQYAYCENISHFEFLKEFELIAGSRMNLSNTEASEFLPETKFVTVSKELNLKEISYFAKEKEIMAE